DHGAAAIDRRLQLREVSHPIAIHREHDVAAAQTPLGRRAAFGHVGHQHAVLADVVGPAVGVVGELGAFQCGVDGAGIPGFGGQRVGLLQGCGERARPPVADDV
ncbi:hypothetical protein RZS08_62330, partial [Arthrospira platensis SPKY1]|nr:hypothetical protein [Arthrospira platensis SPKY1]